MNWDYKRGNGLHDEKAARHRQMKRLLYARTVRYLGTGLVVCALLSAAAAGGMNLWGAEVLRIYFVFAACGVGAAFLCWAWFTYMRRTGLRMFGFKPNPKPKVPDMLRKKQSHFHKPAFARGQSDFDDDLVAETALDEELFTEEDRGRLRERARAACGLLLIVISLLLFYL